jgi:succinoglycan biosynthesis transport protein ExoP
MKSNSWGPEPNAGHENSSESGFDLAGMLLRRLWLIVLGGLVGLGLGYLYFTKQISVYMSSARLLVVRERSSGEMPIRGIEHRVEADTTAPILIRSPLIVSEAVRKHELQNLPPFLGRGDPTGAIIGGLNITVAGGNGTILDLSFRGTDPRSCAKILDAVIDSYRSFLGKSHENVNEETMQLITDAKDSLLKQLGEKEAAYRLFRQEAPLLWNGSGEAALNIHQARLTSIEAARSELMIVRTQTKAEIQAIEAALARGGNREALMMMMRRNGGRQSQGPDAASPFPNDQLFPLLLEEQMLLENLGPDHPKVQVLQRRIEMTRKFIAQSAMENEAANSDGLPKSERGQDFFTTYLNTLKQEIKTNEEKERELNVLFQQERESAKSLTVYEVKDASYQADIRRLQQLFEGVVKRLEEINLMKNYGGFKTDVISPPGFGWQVEPNRNRILTVGVIAGLLGGMALAFLAEMSDRTFRSPEDVSDQLGLPIVGHIPVIATDVKPVDTESKLSATLVTYFLPKSRITEAYRAIRTALYFSTRGEQHKVIQITSPNPGDGKTTLSVNLAACIAQSGKSVLLIDADFRRPRIHKMLGVSNALGMSSVIQGDAELLDAIQQTEIPNLCCLPCGPRPENPAELLTSQRFDELLAILREKFDFVLVDTPPMLAVTDPGTVAPRVDGVLLTIRINKRTRAEAMRATAMLSSLGANVLGVVVNGLSGEHGYGYRKYGSTGNYKYGYGYGYGYGEKAGAYYQDEAGTSRSSTRPRPMSLENSES